ncbi:5-formyltetrahydrofolate cyclo-ligase [Arthrobacter sp. 92]|uniref:5-formyltetrahydrofolate cyclo-ligase n=1 Tax=Arthrobacter sp. 92 TaxID=3418175 RepID=UPI003D031810
MSSKDEIRARHRIRRAALLPAALEEAGAGIARNGLEWARRISSGQPRTFAAYLGVGAEPPTLPLLRALENAGHKVLLPVCGPSITLSWVYWTPATEFVRSAYAPIQEPLGDRHGAEVFGDVAGIFIPATALDGSGNRIGQGGGYYDKFLANLAARGLRLPVAAVVYQSEILPPGQIPAESFDQRVPAALTPEGLATLM